MSPQWRKKIFLRLGFVFGGIIILAYFLSYGISLIYIVFPHDNCHSDQTKGKTAQEIAAVLGYPLVTLNQVRPGLSDAPQVDVITDYPDPRCYLRVRYRQDTKPSGLEITVVSSNDLKATPDWNCYKVRSESYCDRTILYADKYFRIVLSTSYPLAETQVLAKDITIPIK